MLLHEAIRLAQSQPGSTYRRHGWSIDTSWCVKEQPFNLTHSDFVADDWIVLPSPFPAIHITLADVGKLVELRNGTVAMLTAFCPTAGDRPVIGMVDWGHTCWTAVGKINKQRDADRDIVRVLGFPGQFTKE